MRSARAKALDIPKKVKDRVWERDGGCCIFCGSPSALPNAHYIPRSKGGLGIEENVVTACAECHRAMDQSPEREKYLRRAKKYLDRHYPGFEDERRVYRK